MRKLGYLLGYVFTLAMWGCVSGLARGEWPFDDPKETAWPLAAICDCEPCVCPPGNCHCPGCREHAKPVRSKFDEQIAAAAVGQCGGPAPAGYRWVQVGNRCTLQPVGLPSFPVNFNTGAVAVAPPPAALTAGSICPMCGMVMTAEQAAKANTMLATTSSLPSITYTGTPVTYTAPMTYTAPVTTYSDSVMVMDDGSSSVDSGGDFMSRGPVRRIISRGFRGRKSGAGGGKCCGG